MLQFSAIYTTDFIRKYNFLEGINDSLHQEKGILGWCRASILKETNTTEFLWLWLNDQRKLPNRRCSSWKCTTCFYPPLWTFISCIVKPWSNVGENNFLFPVWRTLPIFKMSIAWIFQQKYNINIFIYVIEKNWAVSKMEKNRLITVFNQDIAPAMYSE